MPSSYPFPSVAALGLSMIITVKKIDRVAVPIEFHPWERVSLVFTVDTLMHEVI
jgi:hypothetical protein